MTAAILLLILAAGIPPSAREEDGPVASTEPGWPQWRGPRRDAVSDEKGLLASWPAGGPKLLWKVGGLGRGWSCPVVTGGTVFVTGDVGPDLTVFAFDLEGKLKWKARNGASWEGPWPGARACGAVTGGVFYHMNAHGRVAALEAASGRELWAADVPERFGSRNITWALSECLLVDGPRVFVTPAGPKTLVAALDRKDGRTAWASEPVPGEEAGYCSPILFRRGGRRILVNCASHHVFGVDADAGKVLWKFPLRNPNGVTCTTPVYGGGAVFAVTPDGPGGVLLRLGPDGGGVQEAWRTPVDTLTGGGVLAEGVLFAHGCKQSRSLHALDWASGAARGEIRISPGRPRWTAAALAWADGRLFGLFDDGTAALLRPKDGGFEEAGRFPFVKAASRDAWAHPVLLDGRLYLRYHDTLGCWDVRNP